MQTWRETFLLWNQNPLNSRLLVESNLNTHEETGTSKGSKRLKRPCDVSWFAQAAYSFSILVIALCFVELSDVLDCTKGIAKQMKILKVTGQLSTTTIPRICRHLVNYSTFLPIILRHTCRFLPRDRANIFGGIFACFEDDEEKKVLQDFWRV